MTYMLVFGHTKFAICNDFERWHCSLVFKVRFGFLCVCLLTTCCQSGACINLLINIIEDIFVLRKLLVQNIKLIHVQRSTEAVEWMCRFERNYRAQRGSV